MNEKPSRSDTFSLLESDSMDPELARLLDHFVEELNAGRLVNIDEALADHPHLRDEAASAFESILALHGSLTTESNGQPFLVEFDDYRLLSEIGRGGMGIVYLAEQKSLNRRVAVKILPLASLMDERRLQRFRNESRAAASLRHPNIVSIHTVGQEKGVHFYAMDLIEGPDLSDVIAAVHGNDKELVATLTAEVSKAISDRAVAEAPAIVASARETSPIADLSTQRSGNRSDYYRSVAKLGIQAAEALQFAHDRGVIHRDIKPANLLLDEAGNVHVTDFGLARIRGQKELTVTSDLVGTLRYMSPEQLDDETKVDFQTDIYSLGLTLYEMLSGQPAFDAASKPALMKQILEAEPKSIRRLCSSIPDDLATIIETAIAKDPIDRYGSATDFAADLNSYLNIRPIKAKRSTAFDNFRRLVKRKPKVMMAGLAVLLVATLSSVGAAWRFAAVAEQEANRNRVQLLRTYAAEMRFGEQLVESGSWFELQDLLLRWVPNQNQPRDIRGFEWFHLWMRLENPALIRAFDHELPLTSVRFVGPSQLITGGFTKEFTEWSLDPSKNTSPLGLILPDRSGTSNRAIYDPQRNWLIVGDEQFGCFALDLATKQQVKKLVLNNYGAPTPAFSPDLSKIVMSGGSFTQGFVRVVDYELENMLHSVELPSKAYAQFDADGNLIIAHCESAKIEIYDGSTFELIRSVPTKEFGVCEMEVSPNHKLLAIGLYDKDALDESRVEIWDTRSWEKQKTIQMPGECKQIRFSHDGGLLAIGDHRGNLALIDVNAEVPEQSRLLTRTKLHTGALHGLDFSKDGNQLATASSDGLAMVWDVDLLPKQNRAIVTMENRQTVSFSNHMYRDHEAISAHRYVGCLQWNTTDGKITKSIETESTKGRKFIRVAVAEDADLACLFAGAWRTKEDSTNLVNIVDLKSGNQIGEFPIPAAGVSVTDCDLTRDGNFFAIATHQAGLVIVNVSKRVLHVHRKDIGAKTVRFSRDGKLLVVGDSSGFAHVLDANKFQTMETIKLDERLIDCIDISNDQQFIAAVGFDKHVKLHNRSTGKTTSFRDRLSAFPNLVRFSPDGDRLLTCGLDGVLRLWMTEIGEQSFSWESKPWAWPSGEFSDDGETFMVGGVGFAQAVHARSIDGLRRLTESEIRSTACQNISTK